MSNRGIFIPYGMYEFTPLLNQTSLTNQPQLISFDNEGTNTPAEQTASLSRLRELAFQLQIPVSKQSFTTESAERQYILNCLAYLRAHYQTPEEIKVGPCHAAPAGSKCNETLSGKEFDDPDKISEEQFVFMPYQIGNETKFKCFTAEQAKMILESGKDPHSRIELTEEQKNILRASTRYPEVEVLNFDEALAEYFAPLQLSNSNDSVAELRTKIETLHSILQQDNPQNIDFIVSLDQFFNNVTNKYFRLLLRDENFTSTDVLLNQQTITPLEVVNYLILWINATDNRDRNANTEQNIISRHLQILLVLADIYVMYDQKFDSVDELNQYYAQFSPTERSIRNYPERASFVPRVFEMVSLSNVNNIVYDLDHLAYFSLYRQIILSGELNTNTNSSELVIDGDIPLSYLNELVNLFDIYNLDLFWIHTIKIVNFRHNNFNVGTLLDALAKHDFHQLCSIELISINYPEEWSRFVNQINRITNSIIFDDDEMDNYDDYYIRIKQISFVNRFTLHEPYPYDELFTYEWTNTYNNESSEITKLDFEDNRGISKFIINSFSSISLKELPNLTTLTLENTSKIYLSDLPRLEHLNVISGVNKIGDFSELRELLIYGDFSRQVFKQLNIQRFTNINYIVAVYESLVKLNTDHSIIVKSLIINSNQDQQNIDLNNFISPNKLIIDRDGRVDVQIFYAGFNRLILPSLKDVNLTVALFTDPDRENNESSQPTTKFIYSDFSNLPSFIKIREFSPKKSNIKYVFILNKPVNNPVNITYPNTSKIHLMGNGYNRLAPPRTSFAFAQSNYLETVITPPWLT